jgi:hypothetical protein
MTHILYYVDVNILWYRNLQFELFVHI